MGDDSGDFANYMEKILENQREEAEFSKMTEAHKIWRETTIPGRLVSFVRYIVDNEFVHSVVASLRDNPNGDTLTMRVLKILVKLLIVFMVIGSIQVTAHLIQSIIGKELVIEQEVIIEHEVKLSEIDTVNKSDYDIIEEREWTEKAKKSKSKLKKT